MNKQNESLLTFYANNYGKRDNFSLDDYLYSFGNEREALLYSSLFFPELIEIKNTIFLKKMIANIRELEDSLSSPEVSTVEIEKNHNFVEVGYLFDCEGRNISEKEEILLAERIQWGWEAWLKLQYPKREFLVEILSPEETGSTLGVQFYEKK